MLTERDLAVATEAVTDLCPKLSIVVTHDQAREIAKAVIERVDAARSPVEVGRDVLSNLLKPH